MIRGWFVGDFEPTTFKTKACEVGVKTYAKGEYEDAHYHKIATEITFIIKGSVLMFNKKFLAGDIIIVEPMDKTDFTALEDTINVVVKIPGAKNDKYLVEND